MHFPLSVNFVIKALAVDFFLEIKISLLEIKVV
jgi:hypothetical protein